MKTYNRIMEIFWFSMAVLIVIVVTGMGIKDGFGTWAIYYLFALMSLGTFTMRRYMRKRMEKHQEFLAQQHEQSSK